MKLRKVLRVLIAAVIASGAVASLVIAGPKWPNQTEPVAIVVFTKESSPETALWPLNNSRIWSIRHLRHVSDGKVLWLRARVAHQDLKNGNPPAIPGSTRIEKAECDKELSAGGIGPLSGLEKASVTVQLIDLREIGLLNEKRPLRLLMSLNAGGGTSSLRGEESVLEGERIVGWSTNAEPDWKNGELHLQNFYAQEANRLTIYDIVLVLSDQD